MRFVWGMVSGALGPLWLAAYSLELRNFTSRSRRQKSLSFKRAPAPLLSFVTFVLCGITADLGTGRAVELRKSGLMKGPAAANAIAWH